MRNRSKVWYVIGSCMCIFGCQSIHLDRTHTLPHCSNPSPMVPIAVVEVGGEVQNPKAIPISPQNSLSLRQALLQAGGIKELPSTYHSPQIANAIPPLSGSTSSVSELVQRSDIELQNMIFSILSDEEEMRTLLNLKLDPDYGRPYKSPPREGSSFDEFLRDVVDSLRIVFIFELDSSRKFDVSTLDATSPDPRVLVESLRSVFVTLREFNSDYADNAILVFDQFLQNAPATTASGSTPKDATQPPNERLNAPQLSEGNQAGRVPMLIGIENRNEAILVKRTIFIHPDLIFHTAIGDLPLRDGDFVYAIRADQTSLPSLFEIKYQSGVSVLGLNPAYNAIDPNDWKTIERLMGEKRNALKNAGQRITLEDVCLVTRSQTEVLGKQIFCIPVEQEGRSTSSVPTGSIMPEDQFQFAYASRTPFLLERLLAPIQEGVQQRVLESQRCLETCESLPTDARYITRWNTRLRSYARPVVQSARNLIR
jgi:hypothetical protein